MPRAASARRYAQAVFELALEKGELEKWLDDLTLLADSVSNQEFLDFLSQPRVSDDDKIKVVREALGDSVGPLALNLMSLLATRNITHMLPEVTDQYQELLDSQQGIERAEVVSAVPLGDDEQRRVTEMLSAMSGGDVRLTTRVDAQIFGGMVIRIGDRVMDGSTRSRLQALRREVAERR
ncbi:MAG: ATP synthase F1 subunit delta [SAR202 cluster bacterium]|jgi:F-type H+-transporting ATPase subunit delta|nr:ATP synthase F1 subunit delta [SAR202 cluster bacterium]MDP6511580.1 ATP synthase F1 subunit delta [SAR202 cluster bacterium]